MNIVFNVLRKLHPHFVIEVCNSSFNGQIQVVLEFGQPRVWAGGIPQTGGIVQMILKKHLDHFNSPKHLLLLGIGGGGIIPEIHRRFPICHITAVDIDPVMINLAKKHFHLKENANLKIINQDAAEFVKQSASINTHFDAILIDCFQGQFIPEHLQSNPMIKHLSKLTTTGAVTFNRLNDNKTAASNQDLMSKLKQKFNTVKSFKNYSNLLVVAHS